MVLHEFLKKKNITSKYKSFKIILVIIYINENFRSNFAVVGQVNYYGLMMDSASYPKRRVF